MRKALPVIAISVGDPSGIGPEIAVKALTSSTIHKRCIPILVADRRLIEKAAALQAPDVPVRAAVTASSLLSSGERTIWVHDVPDERCREEYSLPAQGSPEAGKAAHDYLKVATSLALSGEASAIVTGPLNKEGLSKAGWVGVGHTELLADFCGVDRRLVAMMLASDRLRVAHVSTHVPLVKAITTLSQERIIKVGELAGEAVHRIIGRAPKIAVAGINPHAGEHGLFGNEEITTIAPAVEQLADSGWLVSGPVSPDTVFARALNGEYDVVIAMYHDQGHIPSKLVGFHDTVNITLGLPIVRVSVDHGTAYDIAWTGQADEGNMVRAVEVAVGITGTK